MAKGRKLAGSSGRTEAKSPKMKVTESKEELLQSSRGGSPATTEATDFRPETLLSPTEKEFLLHAERGDVATVRRLLEEFRESPEQLNINCVDSLRRSALISAIENENIELIKVLLEWNIKVKDALLHAIKEEYVEAVELLLEWEEKVHVEGQPYSWEAVDPASATFTPDITPLILAAHMNNYEIIKILLDRGATLPKPHNIRCGCDECIASSEADSLRHSQARINAYKALTASSLIALSSEDPLLTAFELSWELRNLSYCEAEFRAEYNEMRQVTQDFATALLNHVRTSSELEVMLNYNPNGDVWEPGERQTLERLKLAIKYKQKKFVAHPNVQQLLASIWYDGLPGFRRKTMVRQIIEVARLSCLFPFYSFIYMLAPTSRMGLFMKKPFVKFIFHSSSYTFFLMLLGLASQRSEHLLMEWIGSDWLLQVLLERRRQDRGSLPGAVEVALFIYIASLIYCEVRALWTDGLQEYIADLWNIVDFITNCLYLVWVSLRFTAIYIVRREAWLGRDPYIPREEWHPFDPILLSEGAFAAGMIFSFLKLVHIFSVNPHLGPIQISLGRMIIDILKFFFIYTLVLFAFGCGMNQLMWYYAKLEKAKCYGVPGSDVPDFDNNEKACTVWRRFANLFETSQSLFWASFGLVDLTSFDLVGIKSFTRFWGLLLFGCYSVVNIIVLLNMLIAMMSNSYQIISERADIEWKFARSHLWMSYFDEGDTLPPPFNLMPTAKTLLRAFRCEGRPKRGSFKVKSKKQAQDRHKSVMANLIARYVTAEQRKRDDFGITEDDVIEIRHDISTLRYELIHILKTNGMKTPEMNQDPNLVSKKGKVMERRLIKDFQIGVVEGILREALSQEKDNDDVFTKLARVFRRRGSGTGGRKDWNALVRKSSTSKDPIGSTEERQERLLKQSIRRYIIDKTANVESFDPEKLIEYNPNLSTMIPAARVAFVKFNIKKIRQDYVEEEKSMSKENADEGGHSILDITPPGPTAAITEAVDTRKTESSGIKIETKAKSTSVGVDKESSETLSRPALSNTSIHESLSKNHLRVVRTSEEVNNSTLPTVDNTENEPLDEGKHPDLEEEKRYLRPAKPGGFPLSFYFSRRHFGRDMVEDAKTHVEVGMEAEKKKNSLTMPSLPKSLSLEEKKYLVAVERGDMANVRRMLQKAYWKHHIDINCVDPLGRGAISLAIDGENLEMLELLVVMGVETRDALLQAISVEFVEAVEFLLEHEELIHKEGEPYSWEKVDWNMGTFSPDITPIILAAHRNNYEIIKILLDRGATLPMPHDVRCGCDICIKEFAEDSLRFSLSRINEYRALASPSLIALSSNDPILTAFQLSWELRNLAFTEQEAKTEYLELRRQCQQFAVDLLRQTRSSQELAIILNHDPESVPYEDGEHMKLARLELAIHMKQKKFVAHPNVQQLLAALWYDGLPGFRRKSAISKCAEIVKVAILFPLYCFLYLVAPETPTGKLMRKPFMKFLIHASSYLFFLFVLILVSQSADTLVIKYLGTEAMKKQLDEKMRKQRGNPPTALEWLVVAYVLGFIWEEIMEMYHGGLDEYLRDMWNVIDFTRNLLYVLVILLRMVAYIQQNAEMSANPSSAFVPREDWHDFDPQLVSEGLFAAANIFSALKLIKIFSINPHLGPLQISVGRMVIDIIKFFFIYSLVLFSFACGLNQLLGYFAELERRKCYVLPGNLPDWDGHGDACMKWRRFGNLFESSQSLFWASFGMVGIDSFELTGIKAYTRFWGLLMFGSYSVINIIVLLNLLIAMMSNSYATIEEHSDTEWKFARTRLWMSYFEESSTLPPPFNIIPAPKLFFKWLGLRKVDKLRRKSSERKSQEKERDSRHTAVMRALVWRYVSNQHRQAEEGPVTEDHINELKGEVTTAKFEMLEVMARNGMDVSSARMSPKHGGAAGKKMKVWERQLMKNFQVAPVAGEEEIEEMLKTPSENEEPLARFRRIAKLAVLRSNERRWGEVVEGICEMSQIGRSTTRDALKNQQSLQKAMAEAKKLISCRPTTEEIVTEFPSIKTPELIGGTLKELIQEFREESKFLASGSSIFHKKEPQTPFITVTVPEAREKGQNSSDESTLCSDLRSEGFPPGTSPMGIQGVENPSSPRGKAADVRTIERQPKYGWL